jgi:hypothetical protein
MTADDDGRSGRMDENFEPYDRLDFEPYDRLGWLLLEECRRRHKEAILFGLRDEAETWARSVNLLEAEQARNAGSQLRAVR